MTRPEMWGGLPAHPSVAHESESRSQCEPGLVRHQLECFAETLRGMKLVLTTGRLAELASVQRLVDMARGATADSVGGSSDRPL